MHEPLCPELEYGANADKDWPSACQCDLIRNVRADERKQEHIVSLLISQKLKWEADLRARVEAIAIEHHYGGKHMWCVRRDSVLALIDGSNE